MSSSPADTRVELSVFGCTTRACSMPGTRTSVTHVSLAATFEAVTEFLKDLPMTVYWLTGLSGGSPTMNRPMMLVSSPRTGIVSSNCWSLTRAP